MNLAPRKLLWAQQSVEFARRKMSSLTLNALARALEVWRWIQCVLNVSLAIQYICICVCNSCVYARMWVCMCIFVCVYVCIFVCMYVCMPCESCMCICICSVIPSFHFYVQFNQQGISGCQLLCEYVHTYFCVYACMHAMWVMHIHMYMICKSVFLFLCAI